MMKSNYLMFTPFIFNLLMIFMIMMFTKSSKFHPMNFMIILIIYTLFISNNMNMIFKSWMPMILFLIMIGGLMIIFMYITSLTNNEIFSINMKYLYIYMIKISIIMIMMMILMKFYLNYSMNWNNPEFWPMNFFLEKKNEINLSNLFFNKNPSTMFMMSYLFYSMICIMNICYKFKTPLRQLIN